MPANHQPQNSGTAPRGVIEPADVSATGVALFVAGLIVTLAICYSILSTIFAHFQKVGDARDQKILGAQAVHSVRTGRVYFPSPHEQFSPQLDLEAFRQEQERELNSYGWVDKRAGVVRIPIERAMDLVLQRGLPTRTGTNAQAGPSNIELQQQRPVQSSPPAKEEGK